MSNSGYGEFAYHYDALTQNIDYQKRGDYFHQIMLEQEKTSGILVDLACGTGSLSEYFARLGYDVIGIDSSEDMLEIAQEKKFETQSDIIYLCQTMQNLDLFGTVDIVLCALDSLNHVIKEEEIQQIFNRISLFLNQDSLFIFDVNTVYKHQEILGNHTFIYDLDDVYCVWQNRLSENHIVDITLDIFEYDSEQDSYQRFQEEFCERAYTEQQLKSMLDQADFEVIHIYADDTWDEPCETSQRLIFVCKNRICKNNEA